MCARARAGINAHAGTIAGNGIGSVASWGQVFARWWHYRCESTLRRVCHDLTNLLADCHWFNQSVDFGSDWDRLGYRKSLAGNFYLRAIQPFVETTTAAAMDGGHPGVEEAAAIGPEATVGMMRGRRIERMVANLTTRLHGAPRRRWSLWARWVYASSQLRSGEVVESTERPAVACGLSMRRRRCIRLWVVGWTGSMSRLRRGTRTTPLYQRPHGHHRVHQCGGMALGRTDSTSSNTTYSAAPSRTTCPM